MADKEKTDSGQKPQLRIVSRKRKTVLAIPRDVAATAKPVEEESELPFYDQSALEREYRIIEEYESS